MAGSSTESVVVAFWDFESCPIQRRDLVQLERCAPVIKHFIEVAQPYGRLSSLHAYTTSRMYESEEPTGKYEVLRRLGVDVRICPRHDQKEVVDRAIIVDVALYLKDHLETKPTIMLISVDGDFTILRSKILSSGCNVLMLTHLDGIPHLSIPMAHEIVLLPSISKVEPPPTTTREEDGAKVLNLVIPPDADPGDWATREVPSEPDEEGYITILDRDWEMSDANAPSPMLQAGTSRLDLASRIDMEGSTEWGAQKGGTPDSATRGHWKMPELSDSETSDSGRWRRSPRRRRATQSMNQVQKMDKEPAVEGLHTFGRTKNAFERNTANTLPPSPIPRPTFNISSLSDQKPIPFLPWLILRPPAPTANTFRFGDLTTTSFPPQHRHAHGPIPPPYDPALSLPAKPTFAFPTDRPLPPYLPPKPFNLEPPAQHPIHQVDGLSSLFSRPPPTGPRLKKSSVKPRKRKQDENSPPRLLTSLDSTSDPPFKKFKIAPDNLTGASSSTPPAPPQPNEAPPPLPAEPPPPTIVGERNEAPRVEAAPRPAGTLNAALVLKSLSARMDALEKALGIEKSAGRKITDLRSILESLKDRMDVAEKRLGAVRAEVLSETVLPPGL